MGFSMSAAANGTFCPPDRRRFVLFAAILASAMGFIDGSVLAIATPAIRNDLGASLIEAQWVSNAYLLFLASLLLLGGAIGDRFGLRRVFAIGIGLFMAASVVCALAPTVPLLIAARMLQGIGAAVMVPGSLAIIAKAYPKDARGAAIGTWASAASLTTILGPILGGLMLQFLGDWSWRLVFAINLPLGIAALLLLMRVPRDAPVEGRTLDLPGGVLATLALAAIAFGLTGEGESGVVSAARLALYGGLGLVLLVGFLLWEGRAKHPMLPLRLFGNRSFSGANALTFTLYFALGAISFYLPMTLIGGLGLSPGEVSISMLPIGVALTIMSGFAGRLADRHGAAPLIALGSALVAISILWLGISVRLQNVWLGVVPPMCLFGIGMGFVVSPLSTAVMTGVSDADTGIASGVNNAVARVSGLFAVALMGGIAATLFRMAIGDAGGASFGEGAPAGADAAAVTDATLLAFFGIGVINAGLALVSAGIAWVTLERKTAMAAGS